MLFVIRDLRRIFWYVETNGKLLFRYPISIKLSIGYENVVLMWNMWVFWAILAVPISWPIRHPPTRMITSVTGCTPFTFYLRAFAFWTPEKSLSKRDWTLRLAENTPRRLSSFQSWFASSYPTRHTPAVSSMTYTSIFITRLCQTRRVILRIIKVRIVKSNHAINCNFWNYSKTFLIELHFKNLI